MTDAIGSAMTELSTPGLPIEQAFTSVPNHPGLYAVHAELGICSLLGLEPRPIGVPLYVGKAEDSLVSRDLRTHFASGRTGSSTLRRSFAALLRQELKLEAIPRNPANPGHFSSFGLEPEGDQRLSSWMRDNLSLATWSRPEGVALRHVEVALLRTWAPPLNLTDVPAPWRRLKSLRSEMAAEARAWRRPDTG
jgi:hypothetical protein